MIGSRLDRKLKKYSEGFNEIFSFFLKSYKCGLLTFCGVEVIVDFNPISYNGKETFRRYDNGQYKTQSIITRHPNIVKAIIIGKKSWGLFLNEWTDGIVEGSFTKDEILNEFSDRDIIIPESLLLDFNNRLYSKHLKNNLVV